MITEHFSENLFTLKKIKPNSKTIFLLMLKYTLCVVSYKKDRVACPQKAKCTMEVWYHTFNQILNRFHEHYESAGNCCVINQCDNRHRSVALLTTTISNMINNWMRDRIDKNKIPEQIKWIWKRSQKRQSCDFGFGLIAKYWNQRIREIESIHFYPATNILLHHIADLLMSIRLVLL